MIAETILCVSFVASVVLNFVTLRKAKSSNNTSSTGKSVDDTVEKLYDKLVGVSNKAERQITHRKEVYDCANGSDNTRERIYDQYGKRFVLYGVGKTGCSVAEVGSHGYEMKTLRSITWSDFLEEFPSYDYLVWDWTPPTENILVQVKLDTLKELLPVYVEMAGLLGNSSEAVEELNKTISETN